MKKIIIPFFLLLSLGLIATFSSSYTGSNDDINVTFDLTELGFNAGNENIDVNSSSNPPFNSQNNDLNVNNNFYFIFGNNPPTVSISSPSNNATISSSSVELEYTGSDDVQLTAYYVKADSDSFILNDLNTSYTFTNQTDGSHTYYVKAIDNDGAESDIQSVTITVSTSSGSGNNNGGSSGGSTSVGSGFRYRGLGESCSTATDCASQQCNLNRCSECSTNNDCSNQEYCSEGICRAVIGGCGIILNHAFIPYACCSNSDCSTNQICNNTTHSCIDSNRPTLTIVVDSNEVIRNETITLRIIPSDGNNSDISLFVNDQENSIQSGLFTFIPTDSNYDLLAVKNGYVSDRLILLVKEKLILNVSTQNPTQGDLVQVTVAGKNNEPLSNVEILITLPDGTSRVLKTNQEGVAYLIANQEGPITVEAIKEGYSQGFVLLETASSPKGLIPVSGEWWLGIIFMFGLVLLIGYFLIQKDVPLSGHHAIHHRVIHHIKHRLKRKK